MISLQTIVIFSFPNTTIQCQQVMDTGYFSEYDHLRPAGTLAPKLPNLLDIMLVTEVLVMKLRAFIKRG